MGKRCLSFEREEVWNALLGEQESERAGKWDVMRRQPQNTSWRVVGYTWWHRSPAGIFLKHRFDQVHPHLKTLIHSHCSKFLCMARSSMTPALPDPGYELHTNSLSCLQFRRFRASPPRLLLFLLPGTPFLPLPSDAESVHVSMQSPPEGRGEVMIWVMLAI